MLKFIRAIDVSHGILVQYLPDVLRRCTQEIDVFRVCDCGVAKVIVIASDDDCIDGIQVKRLVSSAV